MVVNCINAIRNCCAATPAQAQLDQDQAVGVKSNRTGIGTRVTVTAKTDPEAAKPLVQVEEVRSGGSYYSQNDLRMHFGLDQAETVETVEIRWPSGQKDTWKNLAANKLYVLAEGGKLVKTESMTGWKK